MATEKRLIDVNALAELLDVEYRRKMKLVQKGEVHLNTLAEGIMAMSVVLGTMPTVDAVEVVRCKDCFADGCCSVQIDLEMGGEGYCPKGKRRTDNG